VTYYGELAQVNDRNNPWVAEANERLRLLLAKHPELNKGAASNPYQAGGALGPTETELQMSPPPGSTEAAPAPAPAPTPAPQGNPGSSFVPTTSNTPPAAKP
jgi:hypothetical protein